MDQYNYVTTSETFLKDGKTEVEPERIHYPIGSVGYIRGGNRFQMNYGRQRAGIFCVGGVCRQVEWQDEANFCRFLRVDRT